MLRWRVLDLRLLLLVVYVPLLRAQSMLALNTFACTAGLPCANMGPIVPTLGSLTDFGRLRVMRSCGTSRAAEGFVQLSAEDEQTPGLANFTLAFDYSRIETFGFAGKLDRVDPYDSYELCWCEPDPVTGKQCTNTSDFSNWMGTLLVAGVQEGAFHNCFKGQVCTVARPAAVGLQAGDRLAPLRKCANGVTPGEPQGFVENMPGIRVFETQDATSFGFAGGLNEVMQATSGIYRLCYCRPNATHGVSCNTTADYRSVAGYIAIAGPYQVQTIGCILGQHCSVNDYHGVQLSGMDRLTVRKSCSEETTSLLNQLYAPAVGSSFGKTYNLGTWAVLTTQPGTYQLCWCAGGYNCSQPSDFVVMGGFLEVTCPSRYFNNGTNCIVCDLDNYCTGDPNLPRIRCPSGAATRFYGAMDPSDCVCRPGYYAAAGNGTADLVCQICPVGTFAYSYGQTSCLPGTYECVLGQSCQNLGPIPGQSSSDPGIVRVQKRCGVDSRASSVSLSSTSPVGNATFSIATSGETFFGFGSGRVEAAPLNSYSICWCSLNGNACTDNIHFGMELGNLIVAGPDVKEWSCTLGRTCIFTEVTGVNLRAGDRLTAAYTCGTDSPAPYGLPGTGVAVNTPTNGVNNFYFDMSSGVDYLFTEPGIYRVCFCRPNGPDGLSCNSTVDFKAHIGYLTAEGPQLEETSYSCTLGSHCRISGVRGVNLQLTDKIMLTKLCGQDSCALYGICDTFGTGTTPSDYDLGSVSVDIPPGDWSVCWCSGDAGCAVHESFRMKAGTIGMACGGDSYIDSTGSCAVCCTDCFMVRYVVDGTGTAKQCTLNSAHIVYFIILCLFFPPMVLAVSFFPGPLVPVQDIERDEEVTVVRATSHFVLSWATVPVCFRGTHVPWLDSGKEKYLATVIDGNELRLLDTKGNPVQRPCDTSRGELRIPRFRAAICCGKFMVPFAAWAVLLLAICIAITHIGSISVEEFLVVAGVSVLAAALFHFLRRRRGLRTHMVLTCEAYRRRLLEKNPKPEAGPRGACRALRAEVLLDMYKYFQAYIRLRNMYYICPNIVKPLTKPEQLSFAELAGPSVVDWFVSHFWGMAFRHFVASIERHAQSVGAQANTDWKKVSYWVCTFSNNQWKVSDEVGNGEWQESSFYKALRSGVCQGTAMVMDDQALPLTRSWCLFEVLQTRLLEEDDPKFAGLKLCTSSGVLNEGTASMDVATSLARRLQCLKLQDADASCLEDKQMIEGLVESMPGGFETMNDFVRDGLRSCLLTMKGKFDVDLTKLMSVLNESTERLNRKTEKDHQHSTAARTTLQPPEPLSEFDRKTSAASASAVHVEERVSLMVSNHDGEPEISLPGSAL